jgi:hypothetical protein
VINHVKGRQSQSKTDRIKVPGGQHPQCCGEESRVVYRVLLSFSETLLMSTKNRLVSRVGSSVGNKEGLATALFKGHGLWF